MERQRPTAALGSPSAASWSASVASFVLPPLKRWERSLGIRRRFLVGGAAILMILYLRGDMDYSMKSDLIGFLYPAYSTATRAATAIKALGAGYVATREKLLRRELNPGPVTSLSDTLTTRPPRLTNISILATESNPVRDAQKWMIYWVVFTTFSLLERYLVFKAFTYYVMKVAILCWCMMPGDWSGCAYVYTYVIKPLVFKTHQGPSPPPAKPTAEVVIQGSQPTQYRISVIPSS